MYNCFQPLMVCLSYNGTLKQMKRLAEDYDAKVIEWAHNLTGTVKVCNAIRVLTYLCRQMLREKG